MLVALPLLARRRAPIAAGALTLAAVLAQLAAEATAPRSVAGALCTVVAGNALGSAVPRRGHWPVGGALVALGFLAGAQILAALRPGFWAFRRAARRDGHAGRRLAAVLPAPAAPRGRRPRPVSELIAVTAASGGMGSRVAARLAGLGARQRLVVRDAVRAPRIPEAEVRVAAGYGDEAGMRRALEGADRLFLIPASESPDRADQQAAAVRAAAAAGVRHITYLSFLRAPEAHAFPLAADHASTEARVRETGLPFTFLRMNLYMDFLPSMAGADGVIRGPAGDGRVSVVARDDLADVAAAVLTRDGHDGATYDVTGPEELSLAEAAERMAAASRKPVRFHDETVAEARASRAGLGAPWEIEAWVGSYLAIAEGTFAGVSDTVRRLAGHEPMSLTEYLRRHPGALAHVGGGSAAP